MIEPADIIFQHSHSFLGKAIRFFTRGRREPKTYANHVAITSADRQVIESLSRVKKTPYWKWCKNKDYQVYHFLEMDMEQRIAIANDAERHVGDLYGGFKLIPQAIDGLLSKVWFSEVTLARRFSRWRSGESGNICSTLVAWAYHDESDIVFDGHPAVVNPDQMHDYVKKSPEWARVLV